MKDTDFRTQLAVLCCPRCRANLNLQGLPDEESGVTCPACGERYPFRGGVLGLFYVDSTWFWPLHEVISSEELAEKALSGQLEEDRVKAHSPYAMTIIRGTEAMAEAALGRIGPGGGRLLFEPGCGCCGYANLLADAGFSVIALDIKVTELLAPRPRNVWPDTGNVFADYFRTDDAFKPEEIRFLRVAGDLLNLPIAGGSVEIAFSRGMLHHLDPLQPALLEMGRVLKAGAPWTVAAEPASGLLEWDSLSPVYGSIEWQEGIHEQCPQFVEYLKGFRRGGLEIESCESWHARPRIDIGSRVYRRLRLTWNGPELADQGRRKFSLAQLRWMNSGNNFQLRRKAAAVSSRRLDPARERFAEAIWLYDPKRYRGELHAALRRLVPQGYLKNPVRVGRLAHPEAVLRGFRRPERLDGRLVCYTTRTATALLSRPSTRPDRAWIEYVVPASQAGPTMTAEVSVNDRPVGSLTSAKGGPQRATFAIPPEAADQAGAIEVSLNVSGMTSDAFGRVVGFAVERLGVE